ncbi:MAG: hypothetical protein KatS3mg076_0064 [Candidatus Binatia bacterium]|nr:MAG: hypothetical protein KatS3mg076_0064 [Candidatus Binatia bacterium]
MTQLVNHRTGRAGSGFSFRPVDVVAGYLVGDAAGRMAVHGWREPECDLLGAHVAEGRAAARLAGREARPDPFGAARRHTHRRAGDRLRRLAAGLLLVAAAAHTAPRGAAAQPLETGLHYYAVENLATGRIEQRGTAGSNGLAFDNLILAPRTPYRLWILQASTLFVDDVSIITTAAGTTQQAPRFTVHRSTSGDSDGDGLHDEGELVMGTDPNEPDTDGDGVLDGAEVRQGTNPSDGRPVRTGVVASADTPGLAQDTCALDNVTAVADGSAGISVFNIFNGMRPLLIASVDTPGTAEAVACGGMYVAVADGEEGLAIVDLRDPPAARVVHQVRLPGRVRAVAVAADVAFAGSSEGTVFAVDRRSGSVLAQAAVSARVEDLRVSGDTLFVLTQAALHAFSVAPDLLTFRGRVALSGYRAEGITGRNRLFAGTRYALATGYPGYDVVEIRRPEEMDLVGRIADVGPNSFKQIVDTGSGIGVAAVGVNPRADGTHDVWLYDLRDPRDTTRFLTTLATPGSARALSIFNGLAYVADSESGLQVVNYLAFDSAGVPPTVSLSSNAELGLIDEGEILRVRAEVRDDVQVRNVEFYVDGERVSTVGSFPFEHRFVVGPAAERPAFVVRARASDTGGNAAFSEDLVVTVARATAGPRVSRVAPADGAIEVGVSLVAAFFSKPVDPATLAGAFALTEPGPDGVLGSEDDVPVPLPPVDYREDILAALLHFPDPLAPGRYRMRVDTSVRDLAGNALVGPAVWSFAVYEAGTDSDGDCLPNSLESLLGLDPADPDTSRDGTPDGAEDFDGDGLTNCCELAVGTDPANPDTDGNGIEDGAEDSDGDGLANAAECTRGTDPLDADTDGDGLDDAAETGLGTNPLAAERSLDLVLDGRTVEVAGRLGPPAVRSLALRNGAVLTHRPAAAARSYGIEIDVESLVIDATSRIDVSGRGFLGGRSGDNTADEGRTLGNVPGSTRRNGGSYGGLGGPGNVPGVSNPVYGDFRDPNLPGSGGASEGGAGGNGGGVLRITADSLVLDGEIAADGGNGVGRVAAGGSGGAIRIDVGTIAGAGTIHANGGEGNGGGFEAGGGGGGRIALYYDEAGWLRPDPHYSQRGPGCRHHGRSGHRVFAGAGGRCRRTGGARRWNRNATSRSHRGRSDRRRRSAGVGRIRFSHRLDAPQRRRAHPPGRDRDD